MKDISSLALPSLNARQFGARSLPVLTDDALFECTGVRIAFTGRKGGVSVGAYESLNLGSHVQDDPAAVKTNRALLAEALGFDKNRLIVPHQVHGETVVRVSATSKDEWEESCNRAQEGADALLIEDSDVCALLCFADCVPVIVVSPSGRFAVVHAGWRGVVNQIAAKAVQELMLLDVAASKRGQEPVCPAQYNVYLGPHIHSCCFEAGEEVLDQLLLFGDDCVTSEGHGNMLNALRISLESAGIDPRRIVDAGVCTQCSSDEFFSYRASGGVCGRHAALAFREKDFA